MKGWVDANFTNYRELNWDWFIRDNSRNSRQSFSLRYLCPCVLIRG
jgi:hypothetical protein